MGIEREKCIAPVVKRGESVAVQIGVRDENCESVENLSEYKISILVRTNRTDLFWLDIGSTKNPIPVEIDSNGCIALLFTKKTTERMTPGSYFIELVLHKNAAEIKSRVVEIFTLL